MTISSKQIAQLLKLIKNPEDRKIVKKFLENVQQNASVNSTPHRSHFSKRQAAKSALDIISRIGLEMGKHKIIESIFHLFD